MDDRRADKTGVEQAEPTAELVMAAARRAALHHPQGRDRAPIWMVLEHLDIPRRTVRARAVRSRLAGLERRGWLERGSAHGIPMWSLTAAGARALRRAECLATAIALPESPQHRTWRRARTAAGAEIERFGRRLHASLAEGERLLQIDAATTVRSDMWLELSGRLRRDCHLLASARYCLSEWPEPDEGSADIDTLSGPGDEQLTHDRLRALRTLRTGRRNIQLWREPD